jgi:hypothetical protein
MPFEPKFEIKLEGHAKAKFVGVKDGATVGQLFDYFRANKWKGRFEINFPGNGGVNDIIFTEVRRAVEVAE